MNVDVLWVSFHRPDIIARGYWDQALLEGIFDRSIWRPPGGFTFTHHEGTFTELPVGIRGAVVVIPAQHHANDTDIDRINLELARLDWVVVILTGDEESLFDHTALEHPAMRLWVQSPRTAKHVDDEVALPFGYQPRTPDLLATMEGTKSMDWFFAGQVTHERRRACVKALKRLGPDHPGMLRQTKGFAQGDPQPAYLAGLAMARLAPAPSGPHTPDSFRLWEALEAGCVPLVDTRVPGGPTGSLDRTEFWDLVAPEAPWPVVSDWTQATRGIEHLLENENLPRWAARCSAWWQAHKRQLAYRLDWDIADISGLAGGWSSDHPDPSDLITVVIPTSPVPAHPSTELIEATVASVRAHLPDAEILICADGVRAEQAERTPAYSEYLRRLCWLTEHRWHNVVPFIADRHVHQGGLMRAYLAEVRTPLLLFVEHDTPLLADRPIPWQDLAGVVIRGDAGLNVIRLAHEEEILEPHRHLMLDPRPIDVEGVPLVRTAQWSQRPHLARTNYYRVIIGRYFGAESRTMIEDCMHGVVSYAWRERGEAGWYEHGLAIYHPEGGIKRSTHQDGRGDDPKFDMLYAYDGPTPHGAPRPTAERVD